MIWAFLAAAVTLSPGNFGPQLLIAALPKGNFVKSSTSMPANECFQAAANLNRYYFDENGFPKTNEGVRAVFCIDAPK